MNFCFEIYLPVYKKLKKLSQFREKDQLPDVKDLLDSFLPNEIR